MKLEFQALDESRPVSRAPLFVSPLLHLLRCGRARIERGWCQSHLDRRDSATGLAIAWCARGAVSDDETAVTALWKVLGDYSHDSPRNAVARYNDLLSTTQADILA